MNSNDDSELEEYIDKHIQLYNEIKTDKTSNMNIKMLEFKENYDLLYVEARFKNINMEPFKKQFNEIYKPIFLKDDKFYDIILDNSDKYKDLQLIEYGKQIQYDTIISLEKSLNHIIESKEIAIDTIIELDKQNKKLQLIADNTQNIRSNLKYAYKQLRIIARNLYKDWIYRIMLLLIFGAVITIIILLITKHK